MAESRHPSLVSAVTYRDPRAALAFLRAAFGFRPLMTIEDGDGAVVHAEIGFGEATLMVGGEWSEATKSPASIGGKTTQTVHLHIDEDLDVHCERARAAGMEIIAEPQHQFWGDRTYRARDPEGHIWTIGQTVRQVSREEAEAATGLKIDGWV